MSKFFFGIFFFSEEKKNLQCGYECGYEFECESHHWQMQLQKKMMWFSIKKPP